MEEPKNIFKEAELNHRFADNGYITYPLLNENDISTLRTAFADIHQKEESGFYASLFNPDYTKKEQSDIVIRKTIEHKALDIMANYMAVIANFVVKYPGANSIMHPHQDWCFVDEGKFSSINVWIPLSDVSYDQGSLHLLKNSHKLKRIYRGTNIPSAVSALANSSHFNRMDEIKVKAGEAIFYDHRMIHASPPNNGTAVRLAIAMVVIPQYADLLHYVRHNNHIDCYKIDRDFFYKFTYTNDNNNAFPPEYEMIQQLSYTEPVLTAKELFPSKGFFSKIFKL